MIFYILQLGPTIDDIFNRCFWRGIEYKCVDILRFQRTEEGFCYSFNSKTSERSIKYVLDIITKTYNQWRFLSEYENIYSYKGPNVTFFKNFYLCHLIHSNDKKPIVTNILYYIIIIIIVRTGI